jgi:hypothetical protein
MDCALHASLLSDAIHGENGSVLLISGDITERIFLKPAPITRNAVRILRSLRVSARTA